MNAGMTLRTLKANFVATSTRSMPLAGIIFWSLAAMAGLFLSPRQTAFAVASGSGAIFPPGVLFDRLRGRNLLAPGSANPLTQMFLQSIAMIVLLWPLVIIGGIDKPVFIVLGAAILPGTIWISCGSATNDLVGLRHAIARAVLCYAAYLFTPAQWAGSLICAATLVCDFNSMLTMRQGA